MLRLCLGVGQLEDAANSRCCAPKDDSMTRDLTSLDEAVDRAAVQEGELRHVENDRHAWNHHIVDLVLKILDGPDVQLAP
jgi:hypothetical protein